MTTFSRMTMAAAAALLVGMSSANAADLGGNCCADLEERIAELEATTARKGNRKVSLTISGQVSQQLLFWDDGISSDVYVNGPSASNSRYRFTGSAKISPEVTAGFIYEMEVFASGAAVNQTNGGDDLGGTGSALREALVWLNHSRLGKIHIGQGSTAANNATLVDLSGKGMAAPNDVVLVNSGMFIALGDGTYSNRTVGDFFNGGYTWLNPRLEHVAYYTPTIGGFTAGVSFGEDNYWDAALRYAGEFNGIRIASAVGYSVNSEFNGAAGALFCATNCDGEIRQWTGSTSVLHTPTGLFFTGAWGMRERADFDAGDFDSSFYYLSGGVARNITGLGNTVFYGEYSEWKDAAEHLGAPAVDTSGSLSHWGIGIVQHVDAAAMELWLAYKSFSVDSPAFAANGGAEDLHLITVGTRIRF